MQSRKQDVIIVDFKKAKEAMMKAIKKYSPDTYLNGEEKKSSSLGYFRKSGHNRAIHALDILQTISDDNKQAILVLLLAIFGKPSKYIDLKIGRSSTLALKIANLFICGEYRFGYDEIDTLRSEIFSPSSLRRIKANPDAKYVTINSATAYGTALEKRTAFRILLQEVLHLPEFASAKDEIEKLAEKLESALTKDSKVQPDFLEALKTGEKLGTPTIELQNRAITLS